MKKRVVCILLSISFLLSMILGSVKVVSAESTARIPNIGEVINGFKVTRKGYDEATKSTQILFTHERTGAKLLVIKNKDMNRGFSIKFDTPAENDKGINHILEHSVLGGSLKYPSNNIIFDVSNTTYTSFVNALTYQNMTVFPICSENEAQLLKSADIYLDAVFHPLLLTDERIFEREGWRYELTDASADLTYNGIVYNEMQGNMGSIEKAAYLNTKKTLFKDSNQGNISGGEPNAIKTLTYAELINTYKKNYHPSNSFTVIYGDVDFVPFLKMIDEDYFSGYDKKDNTVDRGTQKASTKLTQATYTFPVAKGTNTKNKSVIDLAFLSSDVKKLGFENYVGLDIAVTLLNLDSSELKKALMKSNIAEAYTITMDTTSYQPTIHFIATNADEGKKNEFYKLVMKELKKVVKEGLDTELIKSSLRSLEFEEAIGNSGNSAVNQLLTASLYDNLLNNSLVNYTSYYKTIVSKLDKKIIENIIIKQLVNNKSAALTATVPKAGLLEENQTNMLKLLSEKKASLTKKQVDSLVNKTKDFNTWNSLKTSDEVLKTLKAVSLKDLTVEIKEREQKETTIDGARLYTATADVDAVSAINLNFDLSHLTAEELLYLRFYSDMINSGMATDNRSESQVMNETTVKAYYVSTATTAMLKDKNDTAAFPVFSVNYYGFEDEYADTFDLASDILLHAKVSDIQTYGTRTAANIMANYQSEFAEPLNLAIYRSLAYTSPYYRYINYLYGLDYYKFVLSLEKQIASNPTELVKKLEEVRAKAFLKNNLTILFAGESSSQAMFQAALPEFTKNLSQGSTEKATYTLPVPAKREALAINSTVQYLCVNGSLSENKVGINGKFQVITNLLNNLMLTPEIRLKGGAYGVAAFASNNNYVTYTYRDNNYVNSLATIGGTDEFLKQIKSYMTEDGLESYKLSAFAAATQGVGELNDAMSTLNSNLQGYTTGDRINTLKEIKDTTLLDLDVYAEYLEKINSNSNYVVVAPTSELDKHKEMFDVVIPLQ